MATWVTHLAIADALMYVFPDMDRRGFAYGSIAPDCNVENEDRMAFEPPREVTHFMRGGRKDFSDCDAFRDGYLLPRLKKAGSDEERAFLLGYYAHLLTDAAYQAFIRDEKRVAAAWRRVTEDPDTRDEALKSEPGWDSIKKLIPKEKRLADIYSFEAGYLAVAPQCLYLSVIMKNDDFPNYVPDILPDGAIERKKRVMCYIPSAAPAGEKQLAVTRAEYRAFCVSAVRLISRTIGEVL